MAIGKFLRLYETTILLKRTAFSGVVSENFLVNSGARLIFGLYIQSIDPGATVTVNIKNSFSEDVPKELALQFQGTAVGWTKAVLTDTHNLFESEVVVSGGSASFYLGISIVDNAMATRIENAVIEVALSHIAGTDGRFDSVRVGDGTNLVSVNPDGSFNVNVVSSQSAPPENQRSIFDTVVGVIADSETEVVSYTVPVNKTGRLQRVSFSGENVATYRLYVNAIVEDTWRTYFGENLSDKIEFIGGSEEGFPLSEGDTVSLTVEHHRPYASRHEGRIQVLERG